MNQTLPSCVKQAATLSLVGLALIQSAHAAPPAVTSPAPVTTPLSVGASVMISDAGYATVGSTVQVLPSIIYDNGRIFARGNQAGVYGINNTTQELTAFIQPAGNDFDPTEAEGALRNLDGRDATLMAGLGYQHRIPYGALRLQATTDVLGKSEGSIVRASYATRFAKDRWTIYPSVGVEWHDKKHNQYYYGVSSPESARSGIAAYKADASVSPYASVNATYQFNDTWSALLGQSVTYLADEQYDSPMVDGRVQSRTTLGLMYQF